MSLWVLIVGLLMTAATVVLAAQRVWFLFSLARTGQPAPDRIHNVAGNLAAALKRQAIEVLGQKKLLKWSIPGAAHFFVFWAFLILLTVYIEAYAILISRNPEWHWWILGSWPVLGFIQDFIAFMCFVGIVVFWWIRVQNAPEKLGRQSRFKGSHTTGAYFVLFMIFNVLWTLFLFRAAVEAHDMASGYGGGYGWGAFISHALGTVLPDSRLLIAIGLLLHIGVMLVFLIDVLHSKHLHIFVAPINVLFGRRPVALGAMKPLMSDGKPVTLDDIDDLDEDTALGVGKIEDFSWKGMLDFYSCTECGRCQSQCPAWNTEKPLSPKLLIMGLRDHAMEKAPYLLAEEDQRAALPEDVLRIAERPLVGATEGGDYNPPGGAVIADDVLWSCTSCGACVNQCPVDIEHVDHIMDMRRYQVLVESNFPAELNGLFRGLENKGNPWNLSANARMEWAQGLDFDVKVVGGEGPDDPESLDEVDWLFWVGCAGAYEDRAKKTTRAVAELLNMAGVDFAVLGNGETCTGDPARRAGNEFVFQGLAQQNIETFKEMKVKQVVATCPHCLNTIKNEYRDFGIELEVVHHTQLLNRLVREKKLTPVAVPEGGGRSLTYHDPCYLGRHNQVYTPPRELLEVIPDATLTEMPRNAERSFCCGAGGARMWMEETIGERVNVNRTREAVATGADQIAVGCPFCRVMLEDGLTAEQADGRAREEVEVLDVAQLLLASVKGEAPQKKATSKAKVATAAEPSAGDATQTADTVTATEDVGANAKAGGGSLFDTPASEPTRAEAKEGGTAPAPGTEVGGGSLFDLGAEGAPADEKRTAPVTDADHDHPDTASEPVPDEAGSPSTTAPAAQPASEQASGGKPSADLGSGGSLFDLAAPEPTAAKPASPEATAAPLPDATPAPNAQPEKAEAEQTEPAKQVPAEPASKPESKAAPATEIGSGSLFDLAAPEPATSKPTAEPAPEPAAEPDAEPAGETPIRSLKDIKAEHASDGPAEPTAEPVAEPAEELAEEAPEEPEEPEERPADKPAAPASGEAHQPKTGTDIGKAGSLFDL